MFGRAGPKHGGTHSPTHIRVRIGADSYVASASSDHAETEVRVSRDEVEPSQCGCGGAHPRWLTELTAQETRIEAVHL